MISVEQILQIHKGRDNNQSKRSVSMTLGISHDTVRRWWNKDAPLAQLAEAKDLKSLQGRVRIPEGVPTREAYCYVLGLYFGDGYISCINTLYNVYRLRIEQDTKYPTLIQYQIDMLRVLFPNNTVGTIYNKANGAKSVTIYVDSKTLPYIFPHLGVGRKHLREIILTEWQKEWIEIDPYPFIKGLIHSDGSRYIHKQGKYQSVYYNFTNSSMDIIQMLCGAFDLCGIKYRIHSRPSVGPTGILTGAVKHTLTMNCRSSVEILDSFIGPKS